MNRQIHEAEILKKLQATFPCNEKTILTHDDCVAWRGRLWRLRHEDLICYLGQILQDLVKNRSGEPYGTKYLDMVLQFLDIGVVEKDFGAFGKEMVNKFDEDAAYLRESNAEMAGKFTASQAQALVDWLGLARTWPDTKYNLDVLDSALTYWKSKCQPIA
jgi:hypothetical protein